MIFFSKYSWCYPLKTKKSEEIINSFNDIFKKSKRKPKFIQSDEGTEFTNNQTQTFFKNNNIKWYHTYNRDIQTLTLIIPQLPHRPPKTPLLDPLPVEPITSVPRSI